MSVSESDLLAALGGAAVSFEVAPGVVLALGPLTLPDAQAYSAYRKANSDDAAGAVSKLLALSVTGPGGMVWSEEFARKLPAAVVDKIAGRIAELNGWGDAPGNS